MTPNPCVDPALGERALESARGGKAVLTPALARHVAECPECGVALERIRRMASVMRQAEPPPAQVAAAHARFLARRSRAGARRAVTLVFATTTLLCTAIAFAAGIKFAVVHGYIGTPSAPPTPSVVSLPAPVSTHRRRHASAPADTALPETALPETTPPETTPPESTPPASAIAPAGAPKTSKVAAIAATRPSAKSRAPASVSDDAPSGHAGSPGISTASIVAAGNGSGTTAPAVQPAPNLWDVAATALRAKDYATAERAFTELTRGTDPKMRDAARLARAQLWLAQGRAPAARPELTALASGGSTSLIRQQATEALRTLAPPTTR